MKRSILFAALLALLLASAGDDARAQRGPQSADEDSCYDTIADCVVAKARHKGEQFLVQFTNNCGGRVVMEYCLQRTEGRRPDCGQTGLGQGKSTWPEVTSTYNATGRYRWTWTGVLQADNDWVCFSKANPNHYDEVRSFD
jgi:hypothetical protein